MTLAKLALRSLLTATVTAAPVAALAFGVSGCGTEDATYVVADDDYPVIPDGGDRAKEVSVFKVWWVTSLLPDPVSPGAEGQPQRTVLDSDFAYAILAPGWDPSSPAPPTTLVPVKSATMLGVTRGDTLHVRVSKDTFVGDCAAGKPLSQDDADFITRRIFPGDFAGVTYDAKTCTATAIPMGDAGSLEAASTDSGAE